jgi:hypothetical protein
VLRRALTVAIALGFVACLTVAGPAAAYLPIVLRVGTFDPRIAVPSISADLRAMPPPSGVPAYYIVQCTGPVWAPWPDQLRQAGAQVADYLPYYAFAVKMTPEAAARVQALPFRRWVGLYQPAYKIQPWLLARRSATVVAIRLFPGEDPNLVIGAVRLLGGRVLAVSRGRAATIRAAVYPSALTSIVRLSAVSWVEQWIPPKLFNDFARRIMNVSFAPGTVVGGYDVWANLGLFGQGQTVAVADTGLSTGNFSAVHPDFAGRVVGGFSYVPGRGWEDGYGHGTHVAGSVAGNGLQSGSVPSSQNYTASYAGLAPEASLLVQRVFDESGRDYIPADLSSLFLQAWNAGARIHTNSWGADVNGQYTTESEQVDNFIWQHQDMVVLFAGGNAGSGPGYYGQIGSPATAKNCLSVGASESDRGPPTFADNAGGIAEFSSRGPTQDGRTKPDIVAPGTEILSTRSELIPIQESPNPAYMFMSGTSMSTPLTAGAAALVREYYKRIQSPFIPGRANPSAALVKATILAGAVDLTPGQAATRLVGDAVPVEVQGRPDQAQGWGRANLGDLAYDKHMGNGIFFRDGSSRAIFTSEQPGLRTGQLLEWRLFVSDSSAPFRAVIAWSDYPGFPATGRQLVNDLDLEVLAPVATSSTDPKPVIKTFLGSGSGPAQVAEIGQRDRLNNVEGVEITAPLRGWYIVRVRAQNVPLGPQPLALVVLAPMAETFSISGKITDSVGNLVPNVQITVSARWAPIRTTSTGLRGTQDAGTYTVNGLPAGTYTVKPTQQVSLAAFTPAQREISLPTTQGNAENVDFRLEQLYRVVGQIQTPHLQGLDGIPIPDVDVHVTGVTTGRTITVKTNSQGSYDSGALTSGTYTVRPSRAGWTFDPASTTLTLSGSSHPVWQDFTFTQDFTGGAPYPLYTISGVVRTTTGLAVGGVTLSFLGDRFGSMGSAQSSASGAYTRAGLRADTYTIRASKPGYFVHPVIDGAIPWGTDAVRAAVAPFNAAVNWTAEARGLAVSSVTASPSPKVGSVSKISVVVRNVSHGQETALYVNALDNGAALGASKVLASLGGLSSATVEFSWTPTVAGTHSVTGLVTPILFEPVTTDNRKTVLVGVSP